MVHVAKLYMTLHIVMVSFTCIDPEAADSDNTATIYITGIVAGVIVVIGIIVIIIGAVLFYRYRNWLCPLHN